MNLTVHLAKGSNFERTVLCQLTGTRLYLMRTPVSLIREGYGFMLGSLHRLSNAGLSC